MGPVIQLIDTTHLRYTDGPRTMNLETDWREAEPPFEFDQMNWDSPHEAETLTCEQRFGVLRYIAKWMQGKGRKRIWVGPYGTYDGETLIPPSDTGDFLKGLPPEGFELDLTQPGIMRLVRKKS
jgi:hypothetical protein